jgi:hypothetical protein
VTRSALICGVKLRFTEPRCENGYYHAPGNVLVRQRDAAMPPRRAAAFLPAQNQNVSWRFLLD